jgi:hypothetical protein
VRVDLRQLHLQRLITFDLLLIQTFPAIDLIFVDFSSFLELFSNIMPWPSLQHFQVSSSTFANCLFDFQLCMQAGDSLFVLVQSFSEIGIFASKIIVVSFNLIESMLVFTFDSQTQSVPHV